MRRSQLLPVGAPAELVGRAQCIVSITVQARLLTSYFAQAALQWQFETLVGPEHQDLVL